MGTTGSSVTGTMNTALPSIISRVREHAAVPLAVGFGVATSEHFNMVADAGADGVVVGSRLVSIIKDSPGGEIPQRVENWCRGITTSDGTKSAKNLPFSKTQPSSASASTDSKASNLKPLPMRFGQFGGQYVPEALFDCLTELEEAHRTAVADPEFWKEFESFYGYMNRPSKLYYAECLTKEAGGAGIWMKREDL